MQPGLQSGCFTALATPFQENGSVDYAGLEKIVAFQIENDIDGILAVGTTGESPTLSWDEHIRIIDAIAAATRGRCKCIAGTGSNNTAEAVSATGHAAKAGCDAVLLVDPYYNGPSSLEIRREYIEPVAREYPDMAIIPYVIPGRTGTQLLPEDLAIAYKSYPNVGYVKEATGNFDNMRRTRACCGKDYVLYSGDDPLAFDMMTDPEIGGIGMISVMSNIVPGPCSEMVRRIMAGDVEEARRLNDRMMPLFNAVTVATREQTPFGEVTCRARNPVPLKALMHMLGMINGNCRQPLGKMSRKGLASILEAARRVHSESPDILGPAGQFFNSDVDNRLNDPQLEKQYYNDLCYPEY